ncbi:glycoside hydrolase family 30 protein [Flavobacterium algicola]|uniref:glycoside hydrolase family 30 protein n=1 Tax=Flavobacterium algicola TaxID=556529 RepID=UPI001EFDB38F|nr:hypothetical protein [Flavobacterium algicola]MCG9793116.1 hypothetical protein [Flavobacterium algicola]
MRAKLSLFRLLFICTGMSYAQFSARVHYVELKEGISISGKPIKEHVASSELKPDKFAKIVLYPEIEFQTIEGIGGAFNELGGAALMSLPSKLQEEVSRNLFSEKDGGFSFCRTAIGASDFGIDAYSYSEVPGDYDMKHFSINREKKTVIPYIKQALKHNPALKIFASPWSPPGWMKYSGLMDKGNDTPEKNRLISDSKTYSAYALYFSKYIQAYKKVGIPIDRLLIQNENDANTIYPSNNMPPEEMGKFIRNYLIAAFDKDNIDTEIWAGTFRTQSQIDAIEFVANKENQKAVKGIGIQYTSPTYIQQMSSLDPEMQIMHTEGNCFGGKNSVGEAFSRLGEISNYINYGSQNFCYWNMILDETGKSGWDWKQNALININRKTNEIIYNPDYSVMMLVSKYLKKGSVRIAHHSRTNIISVKQGDKIYLFIQNETENGKSYDCIIKDKTISTVEIPAHSVAVVELQKKL